MRIYIPQEERALWLESSSGIDVDKWKWRGQRTDF